jgi:hypothetical protein
MVDIRFVVAYYPFNSHWLSGFIAISRMDDRRVWPEAVARVFEFRRRS